MSRLWTGFRSVFADGIQSLPGVQARPRSSVPGRGERLAAIRSLPCGAPHHHGC